MHPDDFTPAGSVSTMSGDPRQDLEHDLHYLENVERWEAAVSTASTAEVFAGMLQRGKVTVLAGESNAGKSRLAVWLAGHWAQGCAPASASGALAEHLYPYLDSDAALRRLRAPAHGAVLYLSADADSADLALTVRTFREHAGPHMAAPCGTFGGGDAFKVLGRDARPRAFGTYQLTEHDAADRLVELTSGVKRMVNPDDPEAVALLVVVDTYARLARVPDLSSSAATSAVDTLEEVAQRSRAAVLVLTHVAQVDHGKPITDVNPLTYARGTTALAAAARVVAALVREPACGGRVVALRGIGNTVGDFGPAYFEVHGEDGWGIRYFAPIGPERVRVIREAVAQQNASDEPTPVDLLQALVERERESDSELTFSLTAVRQGVAARWTNPRTGKPYAHDTARVRGLTDDLLRRMAADGWVFVEDASGGGGKGHKAVHLTTGGRRHAAKLAEL